MNQRYISHQIVVDALKSKKMAFITGPRQVGKTTLAKSLLKTQENYYTWEDPNFRKLFAKNPLELISDRGPGAIHFDEIHKDRRWKTHLKAIYDTKGSDVEILVTGSARLDYYKRGGDSLMGRYIPYRLHPFSVAECSSPISPDEILQTSKAEYKWDDLIKLGGFPEPLFEGSENKAKRWSRLRLERITNEDIRDLKAIQNINAIKHLIELIPERVGSGLSINSLSEDVGAAFSTVREWFFVLEAIYFGFFIRPYSKNIKRTIRTEPKFYLFDTIPITKPGTLVENLCALHLLKACHFWTDCAYGDFSLNYVRDKERREVDFLLTKDKKPWMLIECKSNSKTISPHLIHFSKILKTPYNIQLTSTPNYDREYPEHNVRVMSYEKFFSGLI